MMDRRVLPLALIFILLIASAAGCREEVKEPAVAGAFYPADEKTLRGMLSGLLSAAQETKAEGRPLALISPHAGYRFSGQVAAYSYKNVPKDTDTVILIGSSHYKSFAGASVYLKGGMRTPLGTVKIDETLAKSLINEQAGVVFDPDAYLKEHSLEVQLPFLQSALGGGFRIVPILMGAPTTASFEHLAGRLTEILKKNHKAVIVASTDLSHYHDYQTAVKMDKKLTDAIATMSVEQAEGLLRGGEAEMCGAYPVLLAMFVSRNLGATNGVLYNYANSGDVTPEKKSVVGYAAMGLYNTPLSGKERQELLSLAKNTVAYYVKHKKIPDYETANERLRANGATFVTINKKGELRGCIGNIQPIMALYKSVSRNAAAASSHDPRFPPLGLEDLKDIEVEVTVLSPLEPLKNIRDIKIGIHGLYIINGSKSGILLPQVADEYGWDINTFLEQVSVKAGLPENAWKSSTLFSFTADIIK